MTPIKHIGSPVLSEVHGVRINDSTSYICWKPSTSVPQYYRLFTTHNTKNEIVYDVQHAETRSNQTLYIQVESLNDDLPSERKRIPIEG